MSDVPKRSICPHCGIGANGWAHANRDDCITALRDLHFSYVRRIGNFVLDKLEEATNDIGGVIGYKLNLSPEQTKKLMREIES